MDCLGQYCSPSIIEIGNQNQREMGTVFQKGQISPKEDTVFSTHLGANRADLSREDFQFITKIYESGIARENCFWHAANIKNPQQTFIVRQSSKIKLYNQKKVKAALREMTLMTQTQNPHIIKVLHAFQDQEYLYLVTEPIDPLPFELLIHQHPFSEDQIRYIASALVSVLEDVHSQGYALTELSPSNILFDRTTGTLKVVFQGGRIGSRKVVEMPTSAPIDSFCTVSAVAPICPYSAPEILYRGHVLAESDFYSVGVIIYEMMTHESSEMVPSLLRPQDRLSIIKEEIEVDKGRIPEDWESQSADFLIKILMKNPALRLGRYGSFEVKNHPWLRNFSPKRRINLSDVLDRNLSNDKVLGNLPPEFDSEASNKLLKSHCFQGLFEGFTFHRPPEAEPQPYSSKTSSLYNESKMELQESFVL